MWLCHCQKGHVSSEMKVGYRQCSLSYIIYSTDVSGHYFTWMLTGFEKGNVCNERWNSYTTILTRKHKEKQG